MRAYDQGSARQMSARRPVRGRLWWVGVGVCLVLMLLPEWAQAQRPFRTYDPFYRNETARRVFFDGLALSGEVSYRPAGSLQGELPTPSADPFGLSFRLDYQLDDRLDLSFLVDAAGSVAGRALSLSWVALKYYRTLDHSDYAFRLAVDPTSDGRVGFPQLDLGFLYTSLLGPQFSTDFALGVRRVRMGYQQLVPVDGEMDADDPLVLLRGPDLEAVYSRALGWEVHAMLSYNILFDPAGSNMFVEMVGEAGKYDLVETAEQPERGEEEPELLPGPTEYQGGVVWVRTGMEFDRPSYQVSPFLALPLTQWSLDQGEWPSARMHVGLRLMLR